MTRWWMRWYAHSESPDDECDSIVGAWISGWACTSGGDVPVVCAVVDADSERSAWAAVDSAWDVAERSFCEPKPVDWTPGGDRFPMDGSK